MFLGKCFFINVSGNKQFQAKLLVVLLIFNIFFSFDLFFATSAQTKGLLKNSIEKHKGSMH